MQMDNFLFLIRLMRYLFSSYDKSNNLYQPKMSFLCRNTSKIQIRRTQKIDVIETFIES